MKTNHNLEHDIGLRRVPNPKAPIPLVSAEWGSRTVSPVKTILLLMAAKWGTYLDGHAPLFGEPLYREVSIDGKLLSKEVSDTC